MKQVPLKKIQKELNNPYTVGKWEYSHTEVVGKSEALPP